MKILRLLIIVAILGAVGAVWALARGGARLTEEEQIRAAIEGARHGVATHRLSEVMAAVSSNYDDGNYTHDSLRSLLAFGLRQYRAVQVTAYVRQMKVEGDKATAAVDVRAAGITESGSRSQYEGILHLRLAREPARRHWVFPDHRWRAVGVEGLGDVQDAFER